jgi:DNA-binding MarR family transcriptional regulator
MNDPLERLPRALKDHAGYLLVRLGKQAQRAFSSAIEPLGLRPPHCDILFTLAEGGPQSQVQLAEILAIERAHLVTLLDQLEVMALVQRTVDPADRRRHAVALTEAGVARAEVVAEVAVQVEDALLGELTKEQRRRLKATLQGLVRAS